MRLTTWNCARGFDKKKQHFFSQIDPDIAVIQECSKKSISSLACDGYDAEWVCGNPKIGMALFFKKGWTVRRLENTANDIEWVVPFEVTGPENFTPKNFTLIAVWACEVKGNKRDSYVGQIHRALESPHAAWFKPPAVMMGDFNSNARFDKKRHDRNHTAMVAELARRGMESAYHSLNEEEHGSEKIPTFYLHKDMALKEKRFHFDYIFIPKDWRSRTAITLGTYPEWRECSDHCPVTVDVSAA